MERPKTHHEKTIAVADLRLLLEEQGIRPTRHRESIFHTLANSKNHPTAEELMEMVRQQEPEISQATIYNTLDMLVDYGLIRRRTSSLASGASRYDANTDDHIHVVFNDGELMDVPHDLSDELLESIPQRVIEEISQRTGVELSGIRIELVGHHSKSGS